MENILYTFPPADGLLSYSPFCSKVEMFLRMNNLPYKTINSNPMKSKKGKLPTLRDSDGVMIDDSRFILKHLIKKHNLRIDDEFDSNSKAKGHLMQKVCEESLYFSVIYFKFIDENGWAGVKKNFSKSLPPVIKGLIMPLIRKNIRKTLYLQGTGRQSPEEIKQLAFDDLDALAAMIGEGPFALGDKISSYDASIGAFIEAIIIPKTDNPIAVYAKTKNELVAYNNRIQSIIQSKAQTVQIK